MRVLAVTNHKGGSGKTTTAVNLAAALGALGPRVLVVDLDPQGSASGWLGGRPAATGVEALFAGDADLDTLTVETPVANVSLVPASPALLGVERQMAAEVGAETLLRRTLAASPNGRFDFVLVDCPPSLGLLTLNALAAAHGMLVPVEAHVMALSGLVQLLRTAEQVEDRLNPRLTLFGIVACRVDSRTRHSRDVLESLRQRFGALVFRAHIRENVRVAEAPSFGQPIATYAPKSAGDEDFRALGREVMERGRENWHAAGP